MIEVRRKEMANREKNGKMVVNRMNRRRNLRVHGKD